MTGTHRTTIVVLVVLFLLTTMAMGPRTAQAVTADELRAQISELKGRLADLMNQLKTLRMQNAGGQTTGGTNTTACVALTRNLSFGDSGEDVTRLQQFLARDASVYPEGTVSGYYGSLTVAAVQRWQAKQGIASSGTPETTGYGAVGPRTRVAMNCGTSAGTPITTGNGLVGATLSLSPTMGGAPLTIAVNAVVNTPRSCTETTYVLNFGDGTAPALITVPASTCAERTHTITHTYTTPGTFTVTLGSGSLSTSAVVTVSAAGTATMRVPSDLTISPTSGSKPVTVTVNLSRELDAPYSVDWGDGSAPVLAGSFGSRADIPYGTFADSYRAEIISHTYPTAGTYTLTVKLGAYERDGNLWRWQERTTTKTITVQ